MRRWDPETADRDAPLLLRLLLPWLNERLRVLNVERALERQHLLWRTLLRVDVRRKEELRFLRRAVHVDALRVVAVPLCPIEHDALETLAVSDRSRLDACEVREVDVHALALNVGQALAERHDVLVVEVVHRAARDLVGLLRVALFEPERLLELVPEHAVEEPRALGVVDRVADPATAELGEALELLDARHDALLARGAVLLELWDPKELFHRLLALEEQVGRQRFERVAAVLESRRVPEPRHVHRVAAEALDVNAEVVQHVAVEAVVVPDLLHALALEEGAEVLERPLRGVEVVHPDVRTIAKVHVRPAVDR